MKKKLVALSAAFMSFTALLSLTFIKEWQSKFVNQNKDGSLSYTPDEKRNIIPDFSRVGYYAGDRSIPDVAVVKTVSPSEDAQQQIQAAIDEVSKRTPDKNGFRGAIILKKGTYKIPGTIHITASGVVLRGEGDSENNTKLVAISKKQDPLIIVSGNGSINEVENTRVKITDDYVPVGTISFSVANTKNFKPGDKIIVYRPGTDNWIHDLKMDQIVERQGTKQWKAAEYNFFFERVITKIEGNKVFIDNPIVMPMETKYGGGEIYKYSFDGRISDVGVENLYFDYSCVSLENWARNISVLNSNCFDHKSVITGGRRYSFNNNGQLNLFMNCHATDGRHDFVTGARVHGPNVFVNCTAKKTHADIGPHHRWSMGTLYDNIVTDGEINVQDRGNMGSGHGWVGTTQVVWNCTVRRAAVQNPYVSGNNYCIGLKGEKRPGH